MMIAYHGKPATKAKYLARVRAHVAADQVIHGVYWERGKGCAVGCTIHSDRHEDYESELGIPQMIARLEDRIFEGLENGKSKEWPVKFLSAIKPGADLSLVGPRFLLALQERRLAALPAGDAYGVRSAITLVVNVLRVWSDTGLADASAASAAGSAAWSAAWSAAESAAASAAWSAAESAAASAARSAWSAAESAGSAAESAAWSAAESAWSAAASAAGSAWSAAESAGSAEYEWQADTLLTLLRKAPVPKARKSRKIAA